MSDGFDKLLRNVCRNCKPNSLKTYAANIRALARLAKLEAVPTHKRWINAALLKHVRSLPLTQYKRFSMAGVKALQAYGAKDEKWETAMRDSTEKYSTLAVAQNGNEKTGPKVDMQPCPSSRKSYTAKSNTSSKKNQNP